MYWLYIKPGWGLAIQPGIAQACPCVRRGGSAWHSSPNEFLFEISGFANEGKIFSESKLVTSYCYSWRLSHCTLLSQVTKLSKQASWEFNAHFNETFCMLLSCKWLTYWCALLKLKKNRLNKKCFLKSTTTDCFY